VYKEEAMSTDVQAQMGQAPSNQAGEVPATSGRESPQTLVQESIKYRRRAQEAERRAEALEAEVLALRQGEGDRAAALERELSESRAEAETLRGRIETTERDRRLERELVRAGCTDPETALALAHERLAEAAAPEDLAVFARGLLDEKPNLRSGPAGSGRPESPASPALPPRSGGAKPMGGPVRAADRLADRVRVTGSTGDLMAYMRARRSGV
jgi:hypothetical protein